MKKNYLLFLTFMSSIAFAQQSISFETSEGFQLGTIHQQNGWEVTEGSDGFLLNQVVTNEKASQGSFSFKNAHESSFNEQWLPIFGAVKIFDTPADYKNFTISYDVLVNQNLGADFEFVLFSVNEFDEFVPVAGVGIENRGMIYVTKDVNYGFQYAEATWSVNQWVNVKIEVRETEIKYYIDNVLDTTIANYTELPIYGFNMLHNNYGGDAYYDNFVITTENLNVKPFESEKLAVYPNPVKNSFSFKLPANKTVSGVSIFNLTGQKVLETSQTQNIDMSDLSAGTYFVKATSNDGVVLTEKVIKN